MVYEGHSNSFPGRTVDFFCFSESTRFLSVVQGSQKDKPHHLRGSRTPQKRTRPSSFAASPRLCEKHRRSGRSASKTNRTQPQDETGVHRAALRKFERLRLVTETVLGSTRSPARCRFFSGGGFPYQNPLQNKLVPLFSPLFWKT